MLSSGWNPGKKKRYSKYSNFISKKKYSCDENKVTQRHKANQEQKSYCGFFPENAPESGVCLHCILTGLCTILRGDAVVQWLMYWTFNWWFKPGLRSHVVFLDKNVCSTLQASKLNLFY